MRNRYRNYVSRLRRKLNMKKVIYSTMVFTMILWISSSSEESSLVKKSIRLFSGSSSDLTKIMDTSQCFSSAQDMDITADIFMGEILDCLLIKLPTTGGLYPRGFLRPDLVDFAHRTNETPGWDKVMIEVVVVPHVHLEAGWLQTYDDYYQEYVDRIFKNMLEKLSQYPDLSFTWIETSLLSRWWNSQPDSVQELFLAFVQGGRIEIASGMWVSPDEATPHYFSLLDQMIEGHYWVKNTLGVIPETTVSFDPFGYSASVPYLSKKAGIKHLIMKRVNHALKDLMGTKRWLTFEWRQLWDVLGEDDILGHIEQYESHAVHDSCGPNRGVCKELDFIRSKDFPLPGSAAAFNEIGINSYKNLNDLIAGVVTEIQKKAASYEEKVILLPYGGEFYYHEKWHWDKIYKNMKIFMNYVNKNSKQYKLNIHFGTLKDYFDALQNQREEYNVSIPVVSGDFYSYTKMSEYWTGYFTTRMFDKRLSREVQESLRAAELLTAIVFQGDEEVPGDKKNMMITHLVEARQNLALFMHHQAITGTSQTGVVVDYEKRLSSAFTASQSVLASALSFLVQTNEQETQGIVFNPALFRTSHDTLTEDKPIPVTQKGTHVVLVNSLTQGRTEVVSILVKSESVAVIDAKGYGVQFDIEDVGQGSYRVSFNVYLPPVGIVVYTIKSDSSSRRHRVQKLETKNDFFVCENSYMNATFSKVNGTLLTMCYKSIKVCLKIEIDWITYSSSTGPYTMNSEETKPALTKYFPSITAVKGHNSCRIKAVYDILQVEYILPNTDGISGRALKVELKTNLPKQYNGDLAMRFKTGIRNIDFYADSNGFQMMRRKFRENLPFGGNIYPMTSLAFMESMNLRMIVHSAQPHGIISPVRYVLDIFVDRMAPTAEEGLSEGAKDNKPTNTMFLLELESLVEFLKPRVVEAMLPSINTFFLSDILQHPVYSFFTTTESASLILPQRTFLRQKLPCDVIVANARTLADSDNIPKGTSLTLFRRAISCTKMTKMSFCPLFDPMSINPGYLFGKGDSGTLKTTEMSLTQLMKKQDQGNVSSVYIKPMDIRTFLLTKG